ncbi:MAG: hypothetical protein ACRD4Q_00130 [Candidatus Acidiferrales bacterium]
MYHATDDDLPVLFRPESTEGAKMNISVKVRPTTTVHEKIAGYADVKIETDYGHILLNSYTIFKASAVKAAGCLPAARKGDKKFFPYYGLGGELRDLVEKAVMNEALKSL